VKTTLEKGDQSGSRGTRRRDARVESKRGSHGAGYDLFILAQVSDGSQGEAEVGNLEGGWYGRSVEGDGTDRSPEVGAWEEGSEGRRQGLSGLTKEVFAGCWRPDPGEKGGSHGGNESGVEDDLDMTVT